MILVVLRRAGEPEGVVPADRVLHHLDERVVVDVVELPVKPGLRVGAPHQRACRRRVEAALEPGLELPPVEGEEVGALLALDVDDLDELAGTHLVGERRRGVDPDVEPWLGERRRQLLLLVGARGRPPHLDEELGGRRRAIDDSPRRGGDDDGHGDARPGTLCVAPGGDESPKRRIAVASAGSRFRPPSSCASRLRPGSASARRITVAGRAAAAPSAA